MEAMSLTGRGTQERRDSRTSEDHSIPLLSQEERSSHSGQDQAHLSLPTSIVLGVAVGPEVAAAPTEGSTVGTTQESIVQGSNSSQLHIEASIAQYPFVTGHPVRYPAADATSQGDLVFVPDIPNAQQLWRAQKTLMIAWLATSIMSLVIFAPFYITTGLFFGAEIAAVLGIIASATHLCRRHADDGFGLSHQIRLTAACSMAAFCCDFLTAFLDLIIGWGVDCDGDDVCNSILNYVVFFGLYLSWHAYLSLSINSRAKAILLTLNPVSSGIVQL